jgi:hypothetical protein
MALTENEQALFALARERITQGCRPRNLPASVWAGRGTGATCSLCERTIQPDQVEYELTHDGVTFHFHMRCHAIWQLAADDRINGG